MDSSVEYFKQMGLTEYESKVYIALAQFGTLTGYKASKLSNVPKANCYAALNSLVQKGFVYKVEGDSVHYRARSFSEIRVQIEREMEEKLNYISTNLKFIENENQQFVNIEGNKHIVEKLKSLIEKAEKKVYLDIWKEDINYLMPSIESAKENGVNIIVVLIGQATKSIEKKVTYLASHHLNEDWEESARDFTVIIDNKEAFSGEIGSKFSKAVFSGNKSFIRLATDAFEHDLFSEILRRNINNDYSNAFKKVEDEIKKILMR